MAERKQIVIRKIMYFSVFLRLSEEEEEKDA